VSHLAFSRRQTLDPKPVNVNNLVSGMTDLIQRSVGPTIALELVEGPCLWPTLIDPSQLENALLNLCINSRDAMPQGGCLTVTTANTWVESSEAKRLDLPAGDYVALLVTDSGHGMPPEVISRVFEPFYTTKPLGQGTGLGLSMVYGFVRQSKGQIEISSEVGQGTTISIYLPRYVGGVEVEQASLVAEAAERVADDRTILVIDDEPTVRMTVIDVLEDAGYRTLEAADGPERFEILRSSAIIDLLVTDVGLPGGLNGRQVADAARVFRPDLKVLFITAYAETTVMGDAQLGSDTMVVVKPFEVCSLVAKVQSLLHGKPIAQRESDRGPILG
jgi:CheY-like chemotaxis protein